MNNINNEKEDITAKYFSFLYQFPFINECVIRYVFLFPNVETINGFNKLDTFLAGVRLYPIFMESNIKESEFFNFKNTQDIQTQLRSENKDSTGEYIVNTISGTVYNRAEYEKTLKDKVNG